MFRTTWNSFVYESFDQSFVSGVSFAITEPYNKDYMYITLKSGVTVHLETDYLLNWC